MNLFRTLISMLFVTNTYSQMLIGSEQDEHGCVTDGGYMFCDTINRCYRPWEESCPPHDSLEECSPCPPPMPCPMPAIPEFNMDGCRMNNHIDECECQTACPSYDCQNTGCSTDNDCHYNQFCRVTGLQIPMVNGRRLQLPSSECVDKVGINETCGGYTPPQYQTRCMDGLECVQTMGHMIADAPGQCREPCDHNERRDDYGNCISYETPAIPDNCATWNDGCNTCQVRGGRAEICTLMYCFRQAEPYCMNYHIQKNTLNMGEVCYRFCEDGSQESVNRRSDCPSETECVSTYNKNSVSMISFDSCYDRAYTCQTTGH